MDTMAKEIKNTLFESFPQRFTGDLVLFKLKMMARGWWGPTEGKAFGWFGNNFQSLRMSTGGITDSQCRSMVLLEGERE